MRSSYGVRFIFFIFINVFIKIKKGPPYYEDPAWVFFQSYPRQVSGRGPGGRKRFPNTNDFWLCGVLFSCVTRVSIAGNNAGNASKGKIATSVGKLVCVGTLDPSRRNASERSKYTKHNPTNKSWRIIFIRPQNIYSEDKIKSFYYFFVNVQLMAEKLGWHLKKGNFGIVCIVLVVIFTLC